VLVRFDKVFEHGVVTASDVRRTFDEMACNERSSEFIELVGFPVMPPSLAVSMDRK
jgi:hypothetical protein